MVQRAGITIYYSVVIVYSSTSICRKIPCNLFSLFTQSHLVAHRRAAIRVFMAELQEKICPERRVGASHQNSHWREKLRVSRLPKEIHALRSPQVLYHIIVSFHDLFYLQ